ncbi:unnamed protein product [Prunus brigantina]
MARVLLKSSKLSDHFWARLSVLLAIHLIMYFSGHTRRTLHMKYGKARNQMSSI